jgi:hypothetical protein
MAKIKMNSAFFKLNNFDLIKGLIIAVLSALLTFLYSFISKGGDIVAVDLKQIGGVALAALCAYLLKQLNTDENGAVFGFGGK